MSCTPHTPPTPHYTHILTQTTPGDYLESGQLLAAQLCRLWHLPLLVTRYSLEGAFDAVKVTITALIIMLPTVFTSLCSQAKVDENMSVTKELFLPQLHQEVSKMLLHVHMYWHDLYLFLVVIIIRKNLHIHPLMWPPLMR